MSSLSSKQRPRYQHIGESEPYETIGVEKLTPIIGAKVSGVDIGKIVSGDAHSNSQWTRSTARWRKISSSIPRRERCYPRLSQ
jgi:hypothetical protein